MWLIHKLIPPMSLWWLCQTATKRISLCIDTNFSLFSPPSIQQNPFFTLFEPSSEVIICCMECISVKHTHPSKTPTCTLLLSSNTTKVTHLSSCALTMFSHYDTWKWCQFSSDHAPWKSHSYYHATLEFHKLGIYLEQITYFIANHANITVK